MYFSDLSPLPLLGCLRPRMCFLLSEFRCERGSEIFGLEHLVNLDHTLFVMGIGATLDPFDRLLFRFHLPEPETDLLAFTMSMNRITVSPFPQTADLFPRLFPESDHVALRIGKVRHKTPLSD